MVDYDYYFTSSDSEEICFICRCIMFIGNNHKFYSGRVNLKLWRCINESFCGISYRTNKIILDTKWHVPKEKDEIELSMNDLKLRIPEYEAAIVQSQKRKEENLKYEKEEREKQRKVDEFLNDIRGKPIDK